MQLPCINATAVHGAAVFLAGVFQLLWGFWTTEVGMLICAFAFGFNVIALGPTWSEATMLVAGQELITVAVGYCLPRMGFGWIAGGPLAGKKNFKY